MAKAKEFTVKIEDKPGALGKCFLALAERGVNVVAYQCGAYFTEIAVGGATSAEQCQNRNHHDALAPNKRLRDRRQRMSH